MKNAIHIVYSEDPLPEHVTHKAICGAIVKNATLCFLWDEQQMQAPIDLKPRGLCRDCYLASPPDGVWRVYAFKSSESE